MDLKTLRIILLRSFLYGMCLLTLSWLMYIFLGEWAYRMYCGLVPIGRWYFAKMWLAALINMKIMLVVLFLIPGIAIAVTERNKK